MTAGALMVCGTTSDAGKSTVVAGLCRALARRGVRVAPFKGQNMALNSYVTAAGHEIGRSTAAQAMAAGVTPEVAMNPVLLKPTDERTSQVVVMGRPAGVLDAAAYHRAKAGLFGVVLDALADLRARFDAVICEGAGSPAEINLAGRDITNLRVAAAAGLPALIVGDIERGGVFAALYGTVALLPDDQRRQVKGFVVNRFRGDPALLGGGPAELERRTGVPTLGVLPWVGGIGLDAEDSLALGARRHGPAGADRDGIDVAVIRLPRIANFTDVEPLAADGGVQVRLVDRAADLGRPDLLVLPGSKATVADLAWLHGSGLADEVVRLAADPAVTVLGICGGYQMMGRTIHDPVEARPPATVAGLGLLPTDTVFAGDKVTAQRRGEAMGRPVQGYEIHHGRTPPAGPWVRLSGPGEEAEGSSAEGGRVLGTSLHGLFESDGFRAAFLGAVAERAGRAWRPAGVSFAAERAAQAERLADLVDAHLDMAAIDRLLGLASGEEAVCAS